MKNWHSITTETFDTNDLPQWMKDTFKPNSFTKFARLLDHYGSMEDVFNAGPWGWIQQPSIGLHTVYFVSHVINYYAEEDIIPTTFNSLDTIKQLGNYVSYLEASARLKVLEAWLEIQEDDQDD